MEKENSGREDALKMQAAELRSDIPKLDLHGMRPEQAIRAVDDFLVAQVLADEDLARIAYGIGEGKLRQYVLEHLKKHPDVALVKEDERQTACFVVLKE